MNMIMAVWFCAGFGSAAGLFLWLKLRQAYDIRDVHIATYDGNAEPGLKAGYLGSAIPKAAKTSAPPPPKQPVQPDPQPVQPDPQSVSELLRQLEVRGALIDKQLVAIENQSALIDQLDPLISEVRELREENAALKWVLRTCRQTHDLCAQAFQRLDEEQETTETAAPKNMPVH